MRGRTLDWVVATCLLTVAAGVTANPGASSGSHSIVPPYVDAQDGIGANGTPWDKDPANWSSSARIVVRGSHWGDQEARVRIRIEGKGDPIVQRVPVQAMLVYDNSGSMTWNDPNGTRCDGMRGFIDKVRSPGEVGHVYFETVANLTSPLTYNHSAAKSSLNCYANGSTNLHDGIKYANDELIPKKKAGFNFTEIIINDGCWGSGGDPQSEVDRARSESIKLFTIGLFPDPSSSDKQNCEPYLVRYAQQSAGKYYWVRSPAEIAQAYDDIANALDVSLSSNLSGKAPKTGAPMVRFAVSKSIEVVPGSFRCLSATCLSPWPTNNASIVPGNAGLELRWDAPVKELRIKQYWQVEFGVRSYLEGAAVKVNDVARSYVEYDRYDGSPGGSDVFEQLYVDVGVDPGAPGRILGQVRDQNWYLDGARVTIVNTSSNETRATISGVYGTFEFLDLTPGVYQVNASHSNCSIPRPKGVRVNANDSTDVVLVMKCGQAPPPPPGSAAVQGKVRRASDRTAIVGASVSLWKDGSAVASSSSGQDGLFDLVSPPGPIVLRAEMAGFFTEELRLNPSSGQTVVADVTLREMPATVRGRVADASSGTPLYYVRAKMMIGSRSVGEARTDAGGGFTFSGYFEGVYGFEFELDGYAMTRREVSLRNGSDEWMEVWMNPLATSPRWAVPVPLGWGAFGLLVVGIACIVAFVAHRRRTRSSGGDRTSKQVPLARIVTPTSASGAPVRTQVDSMVNEEAGDRAAAGREARRAAARKAARSRRSA